MNITTARAWARCDGACDGVAITLAALGHWRVGIVIWIVGWLIFFVGQRRAYG